MAKKLKKSKIRGSRMHPRKDARKMLKQMMRESFKLSDFMDELVARFTAGYNEIKDRGDVPEEVLASMRSVTEGKQAEMSAFIIAQNALALEAEALLDNGTAPWIDIEDQILAIQLQMHLAVDEKAAVQAATMAEAAEVGATIPDEKPEEVTQEEVKKTVERNGSFAVVNEEGDLLSIGE